MDNKLQRLNSLNYQLSKLKLAYVDVLTENLGLTMQLHTICETIEMLIYEKEIN